MKRFFVIISIASMIAATFQLISCEVISPANTIKADGEQIPNDFGNEASTLLVVRTGKNAHDKYLEKHFKDHYKGSYEIIDKKDLTQYKYSNTSQYIYIFSMGSNLSAGRTTVSSGTYERESPMSSYSYGLHDRVTDKIYPTKGDFSNFSKLLKVYVQTIEQVRQKNSNVK